MGSQNHRQAEPPSSPDCLTTEKLKLIKKSYFPRCHYILGNLTRGTQAGRELDQVQEEKRRSWLGQLTSDRQSVIYLTQKTNQVVPLLGKHRHSGGLGVEEGERGKT